MPERSEVKAGQKSDETRERIVNAALTLFRERGFDATTMREIADAAKVATGAAYYYFPSKDAIVIEFYRNASEAMQARIEAALEGVKGLEQRLTKLISVKLDHFAPNRGVLRAVLRNGADPKHALSPFSQETKEIRDTDIVWFQRILDNCGTRIPKDLAPHLPGVLWFFQMGVILFWVIDESPAQTRTYRLLELATKSAVSLLSLSGLPLMRPARKAALSLIEIVEESQSAE
jgi:AcrR family transcriptional regulator